MCTRLMYAGINVFSVVFFLKVEKEPDSRRVEPWAQDALLWSRFVDFQVFVASVSVKLREES